jgi:shikimate kinase
MYSNLNNIVLIGPMGSGKTTVGRRLSEKLGIDFYDADHEIIDKTGVSIDHIFDVEGEDGFRKRESDVLKDLCSKSNIVIATGGGAVILKENRLEISKNGSVVYLSSTVDQILRRISKSKTRPLLENSADKRKTILDIVEARDPLYREIATIIINTNGKKLNEVIQEILTQLNKKF